MKNGRRHGLCQVSGGLDFAERPTRCRPIRRTERILRRPAALDCKLAFRVQENDRLPLRHGGRLCGEQPKDIVDFIGTG